ncbi:MAG TPA: hypothetical protein PLF67_07415, partial [Sphaerochaeta sp.]|nr:hypothetical protein [Sphaerochaeta sp.]
AAVGHNAAECEHHQNNKHSYLFMHETPPKHMPQYRDKRYGVSIDPADELTISTSKQQEHMTYIFKNHLFVTYYN